ncbi:MAG: bifunctional diaminohydroxyphosphoribosylaminopyrimidine deaminase/5-amino-6-(5-phosphoribosylamino)uracil reductase RibD [Deltaproteobacteria bacterium]|nr:bifunctional diaminohydroxyphosphoribosylaminopyrimidine deaminase/5-amino-6-(5-phosphoribosylamino)uracil reductase RibD [Deltaproteobacteria bacterium]
MREAIRRARKGLGRTSPNPAVGAVVVRRGKIIASGYHKRSGGPHAEIEALEKIAGKADAEDTLYVTLEPCNHYGRTPPCTHAIWKSGIKRVVVGMRDPNPEVEGGGCHWLSERGIEVKTGVLESECTQLIENFVKFVSTGRPFVIAKSAMTLDGWTAVSTGDSRWITNEASRRFVHRLRDRVDGIMVGIGTVISDDPSLTARLPYGKGEDPVRIIVDTHLRIPGDARVMNHDSASETLVVVGDHVSSGKITALRKEGVSIMKCPTRGGRIELTALMDILGQASLTSVLLEGGSTLMGAMIRETLIDKFYIFKAPKILGGGDGIPMAAGPGPITMEGCPVLKDIQIRRFNDDVMITGYPEY